MPGNCQQENKEENRTEHMSGNCKEENRKVKMKPLPTYFQNQFSFRRIFVKLFYAEHCPLLHHYQHQENWK